MSAALDARLGRPWRKPPLIQRDWLRYAILIGGLAYLCVAVWSIEVSWSRVYEGLDRG